MWWRDKAWDKRAPVRSSSLAASTDSQISVSHNADAHLLAVTNVLSVIPRLPSQLLLLPPMANIPKRPVAAVRQRRHPDRAVCFTLEVRQCPFLRAWAPPSYLFSCLIICVSPPRLAHHPPAPTATVRRGQSEQGRRDGPPRRIPHIRRPSRALPHSVTTSSWPHPASRTLYQIAGTRHAPRGTPSLASRSSPSTSLQARRDTIRSPTSSLRRRSSSQPPSTASRPPAPSCSIFRVLAPDTSRDRDRCPALRARARSAVKRGPGPGPGPGKRAQPARERHLQRDALRQHGAWARARQAGGRCGPLPTPGVGARAAIRTTSARVRDSATTSAAPPRARARGESVSRARTREASPGRVTREQRERSERLPESR
jgi:hypothetical protein